MTINERINSPTLSPVMIKYTKTFKDDWQSLTNSNEKDKIQNPLDTLTSAYIRIIATACHPCSFLFGIFSYCLVPSVPQAIAPSYGEGYFKSKCREAFFFNFWS